MLDDLSQNKLVLAAFASVLGFLFGVITSSTGELVKRMIERDRLISLITSEIRRNWTQVNRLAGVPVGQFFARSLVEFKGVGGLTFSGIPEYNFEVYNLKLFESEGVKLALHLRSKARNHFWETFSLMRDAEAVRQVLGTLDKEDPDVAEYQKVFKVLIERLDKNLRLLETELERRRSFLATILD